MKDKFNKKYYYDDSLKEFERFNNTTDNIYELEDYSLLIILDNGKNLTSYEEVTDKESVMFISENLENQKKLTRKYTYPNLKALIAQNIDDKVQSTAYMFYSCTNLTTISGLDTWDTKNITDMHGMFKNCNKLSDIHSITEWNLSNVHDTSYMFENCSNITSLNNLSMWDMSNIKDMTAMFRDCNSLRSLDGLSQWKLRSVMDMERLFENCMELNDITSIKNWSINSDVNLEKIFKDCFELDEDTDMLIENWLNSTTGNNKEYLAENIIDNDNNIAYTHKTNIAETEIITESDTSYSKTIDNQNMDNLQTEIINDYKTEGFFDFYYSSDLDYVMKVLKDIYE